VILRIFKPATQSWVSSMQDRKPGTIPHSLIAHSILVYYKATGYFVNNNNATVLHLAIVLLNYIHHDFTTNVSIGWHMLKLQAEIKWALFIDTLGHYLSVTPKFYTKVLHQTLNPTAELWCKTLYRIKVDLVLHRT